MGLLFVVVEDQHRQLVLDLLFVVVVVENYFRKVTLLFHPCNKYLDYY